MVIESFAAGEYVAGWWSARGGWMTGQSNKEKYVLMNYYFNDSNLIKLSPLFLLQVFRLPRIETEVAVQRNWTFTFQGRSTSTRITLSTIIIDRTVRRSTAAVRGKVRSDDQCSATWPVVPRPPRASCRRRSCPAIIIITTSR